MAFVIVCKPFIHHYGVSFEVVNLSIVKSESDYLQVSVFSMHLLCFILTPPFSHHFTHCFTNGIDVLVCQEILCTSCSSLCSFSLTLSGRIAITTRGKYTALEAEAIKPLVHLVDDENSEVRANALKVSAQELTTTVIRLLNVASYCVRSPAGVFRPLSENSPWKMKSNCFMHHTRISSTLWLILQFGWYLNGGFLSPPHLPTS